MQNFPSKGRRDFITDGKRVLMFPIIITENSTGEINGISVSGYDSQQKR